MQKFYENAGDVKINMYMDQKSTQNYTHHTNPTLLMKAHRLENTLSKKSHILQVILYMLLSTNHAHNCFSYSLYIELRDSYAIMNIPLSTNHKKSRQSKIN